MGNVWIQFGDKVDTTLKPHTTWVAIPHIHAVEIRPPVREGYERYVVQVLARGMGPIEAYDTREAAEHRAQEVRQAVAHWYETQA